MESRFSKIDSEFDSNASKVISLLHIDQEIIQLVGGILENLIKAPSLPRSLKDGIEHSKSSVLNIANNGSLKNKYEIMKNQLLVAIVSYFESAFTDLFSTAFATALEETPLPEKIANERIKNLSLNELNVVRGMSVEEITEKIIENLDLKFQSTKNIDTYFGKYFSISTSIIPKEILNNTICAIECRHSFVHNSGLTDDQLISNLNKANPRNIKNNVALRTSLQFSESEIIKVYESMKAFLSLYVKELEKQFPNAN